MKLLLHIFIGFISFLFVACGPSNADRSLLDRAEFLVREHPDSALAILDSLSPTALSHHDLRARTTLCRAEAAYQKSERLASDSLLAEAVAYYQTHSDLPRRLRVLYLSAYQHKMAGRYTNAIIDYLTAEPIARQLRDSVELGLIYRGLGNIYFLIKDYQSTLEFQKLSAEIFREIQIAEYYPYSELELGNAYHNAFNYNKCIETLKPLLNRKQDFDSIEQVAIYDLLASSYININKYLEAKSYIDTIKISYPDYHNEKFLQSGGQLSYYLNSQADFDYYLKGLHRVNPDNKWLDYLDALQKGENDKALRLLQNEQIETDSFFSKVLSNDVRSTALHFYNAQTEQNIQINRKNSIILSISIFSFVLIILCLLIYLFYRLRVQAILNENHNEFVQQLLDAINKHKTDLLKLSQANAELEEKILAQAETINAEHSENTTLSTPLRLPSKFDALAKLCDTYYCYKNSPTVQSKIFNELIILISNLDFKSPQFAELIDFINQSHDNIYTKFKSDYPNLNENELQLFALLVLGFSAKIIAVVQGLSTDQFYARKTYLKKKITKEDHQKALAYLPFF